MALTTIPSELSSVSGIADSSDATAITIDSSENVAIANGAIAVGQSTFSGSSVLADFHGSGNAVGAQLAFANDHNTDKFYVGLEGNTTGDAFLYQQKDADINFYTNNTFRAKLDNSGNVGIGTATAASPNSVNRFLHIHNSDHSSLVMSDDQNTWEIVSNNNLTIRDGTDTRITVDTSGNFMIGTTDTDNQNNSAGSAADNGLAFGGTNGYLNVARYNGIVSYFNRTSTDGVVTQFRKNGSAVGSVAARTGGGTNYLSLETNTSDGSDDSQIALDAGSGAGSTSRGAFFSVYGNERSSFPGHIYGQTGSAGNWIFATGASATEAMRIDANGHVRFGSSGDGFDSAWNSSLYGNTEVAIDGGGGYGVLHIRGDGAGSTNTRFAMGVGDDKFYMAYDDVDGAHRLIVNGNGHLGVGTSDPQTRIHVMEGGSAQIRCSGQSNNNRAVAIEFDTSDGPLVRAFSSGITTLKFFVDNTTEAGKFDSNGDFYSNDGTVHSLSDVRIKKDINDLTDGLNIVKQLRPRTFLYTEDSDFYSESKKDELSYGFVANEVEEVAPQYTNTGKGRIGGEEVEDLKTLSTTKMIPMLVKAIQEQQTLIETLQTKVAALENN